MLLHLLNSTFLVFVKGNAKKHQVVLVGCEPLFQNLLKEAYLILNGFKFQSIHCEKRTRLYSFTLTIFTLNILSNMSIYIVSLKIFHQLHNTDMSQFWLNSYDVHFMTDHQSTSALK